MWCLCSHALVPSVTPTSLPRRRCHAVSTNQQHQVGESGHTLFATLQPDPTPIPNQRKQDGEISGSDVLWALQRASALKKLKKKKKKQEHERGLSSAATPMEENTVDYTNVRPLCINTNWDAKLDELEKRLHELSHATI